MNTSKKHLKQPPWQKNFDGEIRHVGVELEISGLPLDTLANDVAAFLGLKVKSKGRYERLLTGDTAGDWIVELDYNLLKQLGREHREAGTLEEDFFQATEKVLALVSKLLVPFEIISPPLPLDRLEEVETLISHLREQGAKGTSDSAVNAFGMQFNPELASLDPEHITDCLKAFVCLYDWLFVRADIDISRRATSYVNPFPIKYVKKIIQADYHPDLATLIDDYLVDNPTRNRALDMLPLFTHLDEQRVRSRVEDVLIKPRPTFHYRLPDCDIHKPGWGLFVAWNDWIEVERLAADTSRLQACCLAYHDYLDSTMSRLFGDWAAIVEKEWLDR
jgi:hypothetical protein